MSAQVTAPLGPTGTPLPSSSVLLSPGHWQQPLTGHGLAYFRELLVEYKTLQWVNPHAGTAAAARQQADQRAANVAKAAEALTKYARPAPLPPAPLAPGAPAPAVPGVNADLKKLLDEATEDAKKAEATALLAAAQVAAAEEARVAAVAIIQALILKSETNSATWSDLLEFESALLRLLTGDKLRVRYESLKAEYKGLTGNDAPAAPDLEEKLRAQAAILQESLHWAYTTAPVQEEQRSRMVFALG